MRKQFIIVLIAACILLITGCVDIKQGITVNPDGSGKVVIDMVSALAMKMDGGGDALPDPQAAAKETVENLLASAKGVDAWSDISYDITKEGRIHLHAVAYFPDINKFAFQPAPELTWDHSTQTLQVVENPDKPAAATVPATGPLTADQILAARMKYQQGRPMMHMMLTDLKIDMTCQLPGAVDKTTIFSKPAADSVNLVIDGNKIAATMDRLAADDKFVADGGLSGSDVTKDNSLLTQAMFGAKGPISAHVDGDLKPQFDYAAEMQKAKDAQPAMLEKLKLEIKKADGALSPN